MWGPGPPCPGRVLVPPPRPRVSGTRAKLARDDASEGLVIVGRAIVELGVIRSRPDLVVLAQVAQLLGGALGAQALLKQA